MNPASQSDTPRVDKALQDEYALCGEPNDGMFADFARSLERQNTELAKDKARLDKLENFYLNSDSDSWFRFLKEAETSGFRRVIDDAILPQPAPKEERDIKKTDYTMRETIALCWGTFHYILE